MSDGSWRRSLRIIGPGLVLAATGVGAGDLVAASVSGARYGFAIVWAAALGALLKYVLNEGVARWFARPVDERYLLFTGDKDSYLRPEEDSFWERKVRARVGHEYYPSMQEMFAWQDPAELKFADHMILWSRLDFLMQEHPEAVHDLLFRIQEPMSWSAQQKEGALQGQFDAAWRQAMRMEPEAFDVAWAAWVEKNYKKR